jgi:hypothetical protein
MSTTPLIFKEMVGLTGHNLNPTLLRYVRAKLHSEDSEVG